MHGETFEEVLSRRVARRSFLKKSLIAAPALVAAPTLLTRKAKAQSPLSFKTVALSTEDRVIVPEGYTAKAFLRWGDPLFVDAPEFDPLNLTAESQRRQFGYNCDFVAYFPLPLGGVGSSNHGLLAVNHEFTNPELMFAGYDVDKVTRNQADVELAAHGVSIVEIERSKSGWSYNKRSSFNRRFTGETRYRLTGPAVGHPLVSTSYNPGGDFVFGTLNNCGGGKTPWGTLLTCEENFNQYFANLSRIPDSDPRRAIHQRYGLPNGLSDRRWELFHSRFDLAQEPNEPFRFGWVTEIDPFDPTSRPRKHTALGRTKHEAATVVLSRNRLAVVYSGDDERFDYLYKFVSRRRFNRNNREANLRLLEDGTLFVAKFGDDGTGQWIPMIAGQGPLSTWSQAEVSINTRGAADALGATRMDRPEDVEVNPATGKVYAVMTNNTQRGSSGRPGTDSANPRTNNRHGHIIEISEDGDDHAARTFSWEIFILCGDPATAGEQTFFAGFEASRVSPISSPDNINFDQQGNLWIATDGQPGTFRRNDGIYAVPTEGEERGFLRQFLSGVVGAETASLELTPNNETLFVSIQHPGEGSTFENPSSTFPDGTTPPRPSVVAVTRSEFAGRVIGS